MTRTHVFIPRPRPTVSQAVSLLTALVAFAFAMGALAGNVAIDLGVLTP